MGKFSQQIDAFAKKYDRRFRAIARTAVQSTISDAQRVHKRGGRMRVDTGFLRASIQAGLGTMPSGPTTNVSGDGFAPGIQVAGAPVSTVLLRWNPTINIPLFVGWTAEYARARESKDGYLRGAVEKWDVAVAKAALAARAGFG